MPRNYTELIKRVRERSNPESTQMIKMFSDTISGSKLYENKRVESAEVAIYIKDSMQGVAPEYTMKSKVAANQVEAHLKRSHGKDVHFERQGSVMTNTHILKENDVDLVQITNKSSKFDHSGLKKALENPSILKVDEVKNLKQHQANFTSYEGDQLSDLGTIRKKSEDILVSTYKIVNIDKENSIYVKVSNPERDIDVVTATYYKGIDYMKSNAPYRRGIRIYNKLTDNIGDVDYPFWSIERINRKDTISGKRLKNMIRFLKNIKYDCPDIDNKGAIRSFHINAICYNIEVSRYENLHYLDLVPVLYDEIEKILENKAYRDSIKSVDECENIFEVNCENKLKELAYLRESIDSILIDLNKGNQWVG